MLEKVFAQISFLYKAKYMEESCWLFAQLDEIYISPPRHQRNIAQQSATKLPESCLGHNF